MAQPLSSAPSLGVPVTLRDDSTLEIQVPKTEPLNVVFDALAGQGISVLSMRNKANRLEELFIRLVDRNLPEGERP